MNRSPLVEFYFVDPVTNKKRNENCCASNDQISTIREIEGESLIKKNEINNHTTNGTSKY